MPKAYHVYTRGKAGKLSRSVPPTRGRLRDDGTNGLPVVVDKPLLRSTRGQTPQRSGANRHRLTRLSSRDRILFSVTRYLSSTTEGSCADRRGQDHAEAGLCVKIYELVDGRLPPLTNRREQELARG